MPSGGTNFGINDSLKYTEFEFDSIFAVNSFNQSYYTTDWPYFQTGKPLNNIAAVKIIETQIPFSYYVFFSGEDVDNEGGNNTFILTEWTTGGTVSTSATVSIPQGNYSALSMYGNATPSGSTILATALTAASVATGNTFTYTTTYAGSTQKGQIQSSDTASGDYFTLTFGTTLADPGWSNPRLWLGFSGGVNTSTGYVLNAPSVIQLTGPNYLFVNSVSLGACVKLYLPSSASGVAGYSLGAQLGADGPQLAKIPMDANPGCVSFWKDPAPTYFFDVDALSNISQLDFYLTMGDNPRPISLNGNSFSLKLAILTNETVHNDILGGGKQNDRVVSRTWSTGNAMQF